VVGVTLQERVEVFVLCLWLATKLTGPTRTLGENSTQKQEEEEGEEGATKSKLKKEEGNMLTRRVWSEESSGLGPG
jgi:hypothetical protein